MRSRTSEHVTRSMPGLTWPECLRRRQAGSRTTTSVFDARSPCRVLGGQRASDRSPRMPGAAKITTYPAQASRDSCRGAPRGQVEYARVERHDRAERCPRRDRRPDAAEFPRLAARLRIASTANNARVAGRAGTGTGGATAGTVEKAHVAGKPDLETDTFCAPRSVSFVGACRVWSRGTVVDGNKSTPVEFTVR